MVGVRPLLVAVSGLRWHAMCRVGGVRLACRVLRLHSRMMAACFVRGHALAMAGVLPLPVGLSRRPWLLRLEPTRMRDGLLARSGAALRVLVLRHGVPVRHAIVFVAGRGGRPLLGAVAVGTLAGLLLRR